jgi:hypothetical protein
MAKMVTEGRQEAGLRAYNQDHSIAQKLGKNVMEIGKCNFSPCNGNREFKIRVRDNEPGEFSESFHYRYLKVRSYLDEEIRATVAYICKGHWEMIKKEIFCSHFEEKDKNLSLIVSVWNVLTESFSEPAKYKICEEEFYNITNVRCGCSGPH